MLTIDDLIKKPKKLFYFWGHTRKDENTIDKSCLSNWYPSKFTIGNKSYCCVEQYMMSQKAKLFKDTERYEEIMKETDPKKIKWFGRMVKNFDYETWEKSKVDIVRTGCKAKFDQNPELKNYLISLKKLVIVEASPVDRIWGISLRETDPRAANPEEWCGENLLGFILTDIKDEYLKELKERKKKEHNEDAK